MSTRSVVAFRDGESTTGVYLDFDGSPDLQIPLLRAVFHDTFFRDLRQMRTVLLKHTAGWALLSPDPAQTATYSGATRCLDVPGVGVAHAEDIDLTRTGKDVFDRECTFLFDMADASLHWFAGRDRLLWMQLDGWARIGPLGAAAALGDATTKTTAKTLSTATSSIKFSAGSQSLGKTMDCRPCGLAPPRHRTRLTGGVAPALASRRIADRQCAPTESVQFPTPTSRIGSNTSAS